MSDRKPENQDKLWQKLERKKANAAEHQPRHGSPAFGQKVVDGELVMDSYEQQVIELIRRHHKSGKSLQQIADWLNENAHKTKRDQQWRRISVKRVLDRLYGRQA